MTKRRATTTTRVPAPPTSAPTPHRDADDVAERAVLGAVLLDGSTLDVAASLLEPSMFARDHHRVIYQTMLGLAKRGTVVDPVTLLKALNGQLGAHAPDLLAELLDGVPTAANIAHHCRLVRERALRQAIATAAAGLRDAATLSDVDVAAILERLRRLHQQLAGAAPARWRWLAIPELATLPADEDLISGHLPCRALVLIYGPTGQGKTFISLDLALSIAAGVPWHGHRVTHGPVAYLAAEGVRGLATRVDAWHRDRDEEYQGTTVRFLPQPVHFLEPADADQLVADLARWDPKPVAIVIDTLAWCLVPGDENSTQDMSRFLAAVHTLRDATGASILINHHTGHDRTRERGSTALAAAMDTVVQVKSEGASVLVTCQKQRDGVPFEPLRFTLAPRAGSLVPRLALYTDDTGLSDLERKILDVLRDLTLEDEGVSTSAWLGASEVPRRSFFRAVKKLLEVSAVRSEGERNQKRYWPTASSDQVPSANEVPY